MQKPGSALYYIVTAGASKIESICPPVKCNPMNLVTNDTRIHEPLSLDFIYSLGD